MPRKTKADVKNSTEQEIKFQSVPHTKFSDGLRLYNYLKIWNLRVQKNRNIEKITFKVVQMKFLAMHITNQK